MGEALLRTRAHENSVYVVAAKNAFERDSGKSCIISNNGSILAASSGLEQKIVLAEIKPDYDRNQVNI